MVLLNLEKRDIHVSVAKSSTKHTCLLCGQAFILLTSPGVVTLSLPFSWSSKHCRCRCRCRCCRRRLKLLLKIRQLTPPLLSTCQCISIVQEPRSKSELILNKINFDNNLTSFSLCLQTRRRSSEIRDGAGIW